jgi:hypothetical protein
VTRGSTTGRTRPAQAVHASTPATTTTRSPLRIGQFYVEEPAVLEIVTKDHLRPAPHRKGFYATSACVSALHGMQHVVGSSPIGST